MKQNLILRLTENFCNLIGTTVYFTFLGHNRLKTHIELFDALKKIAHRMYGRTLVSLVTA